MFLTYATFNSGTAYYRSLIFEWGMKNVWGSPIFGMPIIDADKARMCLAIKRSMNPGFAGIENELYTADRTYMLFGDAKAVLTDLVKQLSGGGGGH